MRLLVKFDKDWADEFSVYGFALMDEPDWNSLKERLPEMAFGFGTNEGWEEGELSESDFKVGVISEEEEATIRKLFSPMYEDSFGIFPCSDFWDEEEDDAE